MAVREQWAETAMGVVVLALAAGFLTYSLTVGGVHMKRGDYEISAKFGEAGSLAPGAAVTVAGVKVGTVSEVTLEPKTYLAVAKLSLDPTVKLPADSTAKITSDGLLGGTHVAIAPGASLDDLKPGGEIENTQGRGRPLWPDRLGDPPARRGGGRARPNSDQSCHPAGRELLR